MRSPFRGKRYSDRLLGAGLALCSLVLGVLPTVLPAVAAGSAAAGSGKCVGREGDPDCLLYVVARRCVNTEASDYCATCPLPRTSYCPDISGCDKTTEVWAGGQRYVAIRDASMCACPQVMHGLVIPMGAVSGIEDVDRPASIWKFAWDVSQNAGFAPEQTALVVNSPNHRSQSQLHVHILPLESRRTSELESTPFEETPDLYSVWTRADALAASNSLRTFGVLVHRKGQVWHIHVADAPLNETFTTISDCDRGKKKK